MPAIVLVARQVLENFFVSSTYIGVIFNIRHRCANKQSNDSKSVFHFSSNESIDLHHKLLVKCLMTLIVMMHHNLFLFIIQDYKKDSWRKTQTRVGVSYRFWVVKSEFISRFVSLLFKY